MKKYSHVYVALKSIEWLYDGLENLRTITGREDPKAKNRYRREASRLQHLLDQHRGFTIEAAWAPDEVLRDMSPNHIFKICNADDFPGVDIRQYMSENQDRIIRHKSDIYYRISGSAPYRIDHMCRVINDSIKLKSYSDSYSTSQILYQMLLLSHYIADMHVPLHCDARDMVYNASMPGEERFYYKTFRENDERKDTDSHMSVEDAWEQACLKVGQEEALFRPLRGELEDHAGKSTLHEQVTFDLTKGEDRALIKPVLIREQDLLDYLLGLSVASKKLSHRFVDPAAQRDRSLTRDELEAMLALALREHTRRIFADTISAIVSLWMFCWLYPGSYAEARGA